MFSPLHQPCLTYSLTFFLLLFVHIFLFVAVCANANNDCCVFIDLLENRNLRVLGTEYNEIRNAIILFESLFFCLLSHPLENVQSWRKLIDFETFALELESWQKKND